MTLKEKIIRYKGQLSDPVYKTRRQMWRYIRTILAIELLALILMISSLAIHDPETSTLSFVIVFFSILLYLIFGAYSMLSLRIRKLEEAREKDCLKKSAKSRQANSES